MNTARITKAKIKDGQLIIELDDHSKDTERHIVVKCVEDKVHPDLFARFRGLANSVREILEWPANLYCDSLTDKLEHRDRIRATGVSWSFSETTGVEGACIVFQVDLEGSTSPFCGTTPHLPFDQYTEDGNAPLMPDKAQIALDDLRSEVQAFLDGKRAQGDLFQAVARHHGISSEIAAEAACEA